MQSINGLIQVHETTLMSSFDILENFNGIYVSCVWGILLSFEFYNFLENNYWYLENVWFYIGIGNEASFDLWLEMKSDLMKLGPISFHIDSVIVLNDKELI